MLRRVDEAAEDGLEALSYGVDIGSRERITRDYAARIRMDFLAAQNASLVRQTQFADTKASALLALIGLVGVRVALDAQGAALGPSLIALFAVKGLVLTFCMVALMPRFPGPEAQRRQAGQERFSWVALTAPGMTPGLYAEFARTAEVSQLVVSAAYSNAVVSGVLARKFRFLRLAFQLAIVDVVGTLAYYTGAGAWLWVQLSP